MTLLIAGVGLWVAAHFFKRVLPGVRASMGNAGKGLVAVLTVASIIMMVIGYRTADTTVVYTPMAGMGHLNNLLMVVSLFMFGAGTSRGWVAAKVRHPMLWGMVIWAAAHLLVNGDSASIVLFGGLMVWALVQMALVNRGEGAWDRPEVGPFSKDAKNLLIALVLYALITGVHIWLGYSPYKEVFG
ncbi:MAG: hypothetical protein COB39_07650 [Marinosulfonomonas sp.]|nr:MAG: hypothetical protein COB39_07650 [Marinosulfonomonas sp.]